LKKSIGVALCTYNGEAYLHEQLDSILRQSRKPDAIVVHDDCSIDKTWDILQDFEKTASIPVKVFRNATQLGVTKNFEAAVRDLDTDIICLCDQDDVWFPDKLSKLSSVLERSPDTALVYTNAALIDGEGNYLGPSLFEELEVTRREAHEIMRGEAFNVLCRRNITTGATMAFRRDLLSLALPFPETHVHDHWLALVGAAAARIYQLSEPTIKYRLHGKNVIGLRKPSRLEKCKEIWWYLHKKKRGWAKDQIKSRAEFIRRVESHPQVPENIVSHFQEAMDFSRFREALPDSVFTRSPAVLWQVARGRYKRFEYAWEREAFLDLFNK
jgi:glycosyltransferase involved in cell wall biosynthesis